MLTKLVLKAMSDDVLKNFYIERPVAKMVDENPQEPWSDDVSIRTQQRKEAAEKKGHIYTSFWTHVKNSSFGNDQAAAIVHAHRIKISNTIMDFITHINYDSFVTDVPEFPADFKPLFVQDEFKIKECEENEKSYNYASDVEKLLEDKIKRFIHHVLTSDAVTKKETYDKGIHYQWVVMGCPQLLRYLTISGDLNFRPFTETKVLDVPMLQVQFKNRLFVFPIVTDGDGNMVTLFRLEHDTPEASYVNGKTYYGYESHIHLYLTLPVLGQFHAKEFEPFAPKIPVKLE